MDKKTTMMMLFLLVMAITIVPAQAEAPWDAPLRTVLDALVGPTAMVIFTILVAVMGFAVAVTQGQALKQGFIWLLIGGGIVFSASNVLNMLFPAAGAR